MAVLDSTRGLVRAARRLGRRPDPTAAVHDALADPRRYRDRIDRLHVRHLQGRAAHELREGDVSLAAVAVRRDEVARLLAATVARGEYRFEPGERRTIRVDAKRRTVYAFGLADLIVQGVVCDLLETAVEPTLSGALCSYRPGIAWWVATRRLAAFVRTHRAERPDPRSRGLYVLRRDVASYTDTIPVDESSPIWPDLRGALEGSQRGAPLRPADWRLVEDVVRPEIAETGGGSRRMARGVPTGQPISSVAFNLYLRDLDHELSAVDGAFYARYSDDLVFAHPDPGTARAAADRIAAAVASRGLALNEGKSRDLYLTAAGRPSVAWPEARGTDHVAFLGLHVDGRGTIALDGPKAREVVRDLRRRAASAATAGAPGNERRALVARVLRRALEPDDPSRSLRSANLLREVVTDRRQLAELDRLIAAAAAEAVTGRRGPTAMRFAPPRALRAVGLPSLVAARNRVGKRRSTPA